MADPRTDPRTESDRPPADLLGGRLFQVKNHLKKQTSKKQFVLAILGIFGHFDVNSALFFDPKWILGTIRL